jgi:hypothetical protein
MDAPQYGNLARDDLATQRGLTRLMGFRSAQFILNGWELCRWLERLILIGLTWGRFPGRSHGDAGDIGQGTNDPVMKP